MSLTIVVGIAVGIGIVILACGVICIRSACSPPKKSRNTRKRPVNTVPPQRMPTKRSNGNSAPLPPPPQSPGRAPIRPEVVHGPLPPPPPSFLMEKEGAFVENEYSSIAEMPPPPPSPSPQVAPQGTVIVNKMAAGYLDRSDSDPDYTSPPSPYSSPRHTHYDIQSLRSSEDNLASDCEIPVQYFYKNKYSVAEPVDNSKFSMKIYTKSPSSELPPYYEEEEEAAAAAAAATVFVREDARDPTRPYECQNGQAQNPFAGSLQSRYWRNKYTGAFIPNIHASKTSLCSRSGGSTV
ncbi:hypothetical protein LSH36_435g02062 [Paralvinella palmiformis]|uniref:Uncharacterized protein n=1 Tax=Paralvinella palmiformis TaxID=53620 RepID=A0AAD9MZF5_9ANNE|nr:hypothetical protein LSH36_435g02062 [Paralvinella palmiformis]